jgi:hypothetical protein
VCTQAVNETVGACIVCVCVCVCICIYPSREGDSGGVYWKFKATENTRFSEFLEVADQLHIALAQSVEVERGEHKILLV